MLAWMVLVHALKLCPYQCALWMQGGGRIARERLGLYTPKKWEQSKVRGNGGGGVTKKKRAEDGSPTLGHRPRDSKRSQVEREKLRKKRKGYQDLIKRWLPDQMIVLPRRSNCNTAKEQPCDVIVF